MSFFSCWWVLLLDFSHFLTLDPLHNHRLSAVSAKGFCSILQNKSNWSSSFFCPELLDLYYRKRKLVFPNFMITFKVNWIKTFTINNVCKKKLRIIILWESSVGNEEGCFNCKHTWVKIIKTEINLFSKITSPSFSEQNQRKMKLNAVHLQSKQKQKCLYERFYSFISFNMHFRANKGLLYNNNLSIYYLLSTYKSRDNQSDEYKIKYK